MASDTRIRVGTTPNDGKGDPAREAGLKINLFQDRTEAALTLATPEQAREGTATGFLMDPSLTQQAITAQIGSAFAAWFTGLPTDPTGLSSGDFWNNGGTIAQVP